MGSKLQKNQSTSVDDWCAEVFRMNYLMGYGLTDPMIEGWAKTIHKLRPKTTLKQLEETIDMILIGKTDFNPQRGIRDLLKALEPKPDYSGITG